jgi:hypothetical protein
VQSVGCFTWQGRCNARSNQLGSVVHERVFRWLAAGRRNNGVPWGSLVISGAGVYEQVIDAAPTLLLAIGGLSVVLLVSFAVVRIVISGLTEADI